MTIFLGLKPKRLNKIDDLSDGIAARELAGHLSEDGANAILKRIRVGILIAEPFQPREQLLPDEVQQFVALQHLLIIKPALGIQRIGPLAPTQPSRQCRFVNLAIQPRFQLALILPRIKITQEQEPTRLLHVIKRTRTPASGLLQDIVNRLKNARRRHCILLFSQILRHLPTTSAIPFRYVSSLLTLFFAVIFLSNIIPKSKPTAPLPKGSIPEYPTECGFLWRLA